MRRFRMLAVFGSLMLLFGAGLVRAQQPPLPPPDQTLSPQQLENLVAPIALYPDPLLTQIMVAATYPLEVVEAQQWLQRNPGITGTALTEAAQQQNWDASVQALVIFPDVLKRLNDDVTWTTNLGNAFLAQQAEVMDAVQRLRQQAQQAGKLKSTPQETVTTVPDQAGAAAIDIEPADPAVIYVPVYNPAWIWGPPLYYPYPGWFWPPYPGAGIYFGFGGGIRIGLFFGGGWGGWGGWGWHPGWGAQYGDRQQHFHSPLQFQFGPPGATARDFGLGARRLAPWGRAVCAGQELANRYQTGVRDNLRTAATQQARQAGSQSNERMGNRSVPQNNPKGGLFGGMGNGQAARIHSDHGFSSLGARGTGGGGGGGHAGGGGGGRRK